MFNKIWLISLVFTITISGVFATEYVNSSYSKGVGYSIEDPNSYSKTVGGYECMSKEVGHSPNNPDSYSKNIFTIVFGKFLKNK